MNKENKTENYYSDNSSIVVKEVPKEKRKRSGPIPGGLSVDRVIRFKERRSSRADKERCDS